MICCNTPLCESAGAPSILCKRPTKPILCFSYSIIIFCPLSLICPFDSSKLHSGVAQLISSLLRPLVLFAGKALPRTIKAYRSNRLRGISFFCFCFCFCFCFYPELGHSIRDRSELPSELAVCCQTAAASHVRAPLTSNSPAVKSRQPAT
jgi:hypothetical protein